MTTLGLLALSLVLAVIALATLIVAFVRWRRRRAIGRRALAAVTAVLAGVSLWVWWLDWAGATLSVVRAADGTTVRLVRRYDPGFLYGWSHYFVQVDGFRRRVRLLSLPAEWRGTPDDLAAPRRRQRIAVVWATERPSFRSIERHVAAVPSDGALQRTVSR